MGSPVRGRLAHHGDQALRARPPRDATSTRSPTRRASQVATGRRTRAAAGEPSRVHLPPCGALEDETARASRGERGPSVQSGGRRAYGTPSHVARQRVASAGAGTARCGRTQERRPGSPSRSPPGSLRRPLRRRSASACRESGGCGSPAGSGAARRNRGRPHARLDARQVGGSSSIESPPSTLPAQVSRAPSSRSLSGRERPAPACSRGGSESKNIRFGSPGYGRCVNADEHRVRVER